jgi:5-formyltetrahydrofolate cyclo-ligase
MNKAKLRKQILQQRKMLPELTWQHKSDRLCDQLSSIPAFQTAQTILAYFSINQEPDLHSLFSSSKKWAFPRCLNQQLTWHLWQPEDPLEIGLYGVKNPLINAPQIEAKQVDLILVPALACDHQGYRLGYGGGYYDRLFSNRKWSKIPKIGIIFEFAYLANLPVDPWDQKLQGICTELNYYEIN